MARLPLVYHGRVTYYEFLVIGAGMRLLKQLVLRLAATDFVRSAIEERSDLTAFRGKPTPRVVAGLGVIALSYVIGWPAVALLGFLSIRLGNPWLVAVGGPLTYGLSHLVFLLGMYLAGALYSMIFLRWLTRVAMERLLAWAGGTARCCGLLPLGLAVVLAGMGGDAQAHEPSLQELASRFSPEAYLARQRHAEVQVLAVGKGAQRAYAFVPASPRPARAPLILFHHGWLGVSPMNFGALIDHLVRCGAVVIYPVYQTPPQTLPREVTALAAAADRDAVAAVEAVCPKLIDRDKVLYYGYSIGAAIAINLARAPARHGVPPPRGLVLAAPGDAHHVLHGPEGASIIGETRDLPADLPVVLVTGAADTAIGVPTARALAQGLCQVRADRRTLLILPSDESGEARVKAGHGSPGAPDSRYDFRDASGPVPERIPARPGFEASASLNALDFGGYWKVVSGLLDWLETGRYPTEVFGRGTEARFLGLWPDGTPYRPALIEDVCGDRG
ncbi:MAG: hypothetical protein BWK76_15035 [Desulfobulbaceae bacterium A2]|nr:MAG: hypothetical protein BWK76_15035 [Desulfobulbaceae bacterium A2]